MCKRMLPRTLNRIIQGSFGCPDATPSRTVMIKQMVVKLFAHWYEV